jgi:putative addiction module antidote
MDTEWRKGKIQICNDLFNGDIITIVKTRISGGHMHTLKLTQIGNSVGLILPKEVLTRLKLVKGDTIFLTDAPGAVTITPHNPSFEEQLEIGREFMREYRDTFNALAK